MYVILSGVEKIFIGVRVILKLLYYKLKYGKRLKIGKKVRFRKGFILNIAKDGSVEIGDGTFFNNYCSVNCHNKVTIGKNNLFGESVKIYDHNHVFNNKRVNMKKTYKSNSVAIGDRNWFGSGVVVLNKAKIGSYNVFGSNLVINSEFGSENIVRSVGEYRVEKIRYSEGADGKE